MVRKTKVILQPVKFRKRDHIAVLSLSNHDVDEIVRNIDGAEWSTGYRFWHLPYSVETLDVLDRQLGEIAVVDKSSFRNFNPESQPEKKIRKKRVKVGPPNTEQTKILKTMEEKFRKTYSESTVKIYMSLLNVFFGWFNQKKEEDISREDIRDFITSYIDKNEYSPNYKRLMINIIRRYFILKGKEGLVKGFA
ncbi:MAG: phage integrase N-terminal SAM-like domain-containing protein [Prolixibacteraceae bacterium]|nr:phage integrase N-terminal SAM-like domain-containing protein [Prolixibacteraceae bacterium]